MWVAPREREREGGGLWKIGGSELQNVFQRCENLESYYRLKSFMIALLKGIHLLRSRRWCGARWKITKANLGCYDLDLDFPDELRLGRVCSSRVI